VLNQQMLNLDALKEDDESALNTPALNVNGSRMNTQQLFLNAKEVVIDHLNDTYVLRLTKQNKLILTKR
jgi:hemin uptake protein HemP